MNLNKKGVMHNGFHVNHFFSHTARLWNSLHLESSPLAFGLNGSKCIQLKGTFYLYVFSNQFS